MSYSATLGRFLERDPLGAQMGPEHRSNDDAQSIFPAVEGRSGSSAAVRKALDAEGRARKWAKRMFGKGHADDVWLWQYKDGMNVYEFVGSNPVNRTDPSGMDRYVVDGGGGHHGIAVDTWGMQNGKWVKTGVVTYDFSADYRWGPLILGSLTFGCPGRVRMTPGINGTIESTIPSSPQADGILKGNLDAAVINPPIYHIGFYNCNWFVQFHLLDGINTQPVERNASDERDPAEIAPWHL